MIEYPPLLRGSAEQQIALLRDYLVRQVRANKSEDQGEGGGIQASAPSSGSGKNKAALQEEYNRYRDLRALIVKTADIVEEHVDMLRQELHADYLAISDFGTYQERVDTQIEATARAIVESYDFQGKIDAAEMRAVESIQGEIRRGFIDPPGGGARVFGIAIAEKLRFSSTTVTQDGLEYVELDSGQTMGIYTASGWQFWLNGAKAGWFDSADGQLHVNTMTAESGIRMGSNWVISGAGGFGIRYLGG